jgi:hypothetical protein
MDIRLPAWAERHPVAPNTVLVDPDLMYPAFLKELGIKDPTQYWIETCYQMMKLDLQVAMRTFGFTIHVRGDDGRRSRWRLARFPDPDAKSVVHDGHRFVVPGTSGVDRATKGKQAREHYRRLRGFLPG